MALSAPASSSCRQRVRYCSDRQARRPTSSLRFWSPSLSCASLKREAYSSKQEDRISTRAKHLETLLDWKSAGCFCCRDSPAHPQSPTPSHCIWDTFGLLWEAALGVQ